MPVLRFLLLASLALCLLACSDPLAPGEYRGEVIFRAQGIVESAGTESWRELRPVIAFKTETHLQLVDSISVRPRDASGISGDFELELYDVPPDETYLDFEEHPDWGKVAFGMIAAVPHDHPQRLDNRHASAGDADCSSDPGCPCPPGQTTRYFDYSYGSDPETYHESFCCPEPDSPTEACELVGAEGDPEIKNKPALPVDAVVQNFLLFYIDRDAPAGSAFARYLFHSDAGLQAGYHLLKVSALSERPGPEGDSEYVIEGSDGVAYYQFEVVEPDKVALKFQRGVVPWGINL